MFKNIKVTTSDEYDELNGYTDGSNSDGWLAVWFDRQQLAEVVGPYDIRFLEPLEAWNETERPFAIIYFDDEEMVIPAGTITVDGKEIEVYRLPGFEFVEAE
jgi:hypothetical protein